ncbi:MAG: hypothetical protein CMJ59_07180 [Planctomycetaceae bacterium]|nr:hypothetical protein [Planctomycetaceae bacterium]
MMPTADRRRFLAALLGTLLLLPQPRGARPAEPIRLTTDGRLKASPMFVNQSTELVFAVLETPQRYRIMRMDLASGSEQPLRKEAATAEFEPAGSRDGRYYAFVHQRGVLSLSLAILDTQSNTLAEVLPPAGFAGMRSPAFAPDNSTVLYSFADGGRQQIFSTTVQAKGTKQLTDSPGVNNWPCFSPNGEQIVFGSSRDGNFDIYLMDRDGTGARRLTRSPYQDIRPRFSPDGKQIAFVSHRNGNSEIYLIRPDGTDLQRVTHHPERDDYPDWHTDGKRLVILSEREGQHDLYLVDIP